MNDRRMAVIFICRDCGARFGGHEVSVPDAEPRSEEKVSIDENKCPNSAGILDVQFPGGAHAEQ